MACRCGASVVWVEVLVWIQGVDVVLYTAPGVWQVGVGGEQGVVGQRCSMLWSLVAPGGGQVGVDVVLHSA